MVAPDERREKVFYEINRPTFARLKPPLLKICRFIPYSELKKEVEQIGSRMRYMKPEFIAEILKAVNQIIHKSLVLASICLLICEELGRIEAG
jgi:hypothetical protein